MPFLTIGASWPQANLSTIHSTYAIFNFTPLTFQMTTDYYSAFAGVLHAGISTFTAMIPNMSPDWEWSLTCIHSQSVMKLVCNGI